MRKIKKHNFFPSVQYAEKVRELSRFIEPLRQKIAAMGREDDEKLAKEQSLKNHE